MAGVHEEDFEDEHGEVDYEAYYEALYTYEEQIFEERRDDVLLEEAAKEGEDA